ncbi:MAG: Holliday junction branch migration protein RuvA [Angelakisella sp.]
MIYSVTGKLMLLEPSFVVVEAGGIGYRCTTTTYTLSQMPQRGTTVTLYTHLYVREDLLELYGFASYEELTAFRMLITVSGVGPKVALAILSGTSPDRLMLSIAAADVKALKVPGVGPKIAQRIILELKDKVGNEAVAAGVRGSDFSPVSNAAPSSQSEAISALVALGYGQTDAASVVSKLDGSLTAEELIKMSLKKLARG